MLPCLSSLRALFPAAALVLVAGCSSSVIVDGSGGQAGSGGTGGSPGGQQHPACSQPSPSPLPPLPEVNQTASGRPGFDLWRDVDCDVAAAYLCGAAGTGEVCQKLTICLTSDPAEGGACTYLDADLWCDGEGEAMGFRDAECWMCAPVESHAAACCAGLGGFDCRTWPYPSNGAQGTVCAVHEDCEPGLVCGASNGKGFGICQCPGLDPDGVGPAADCF